jgi:UDP-N-acetylglucosamine 4,6-dehydratase
MIDLNKKSILTTGGIGSLGKTVTKRILKEWANVKRLVFFSRDEQRQFQLAQEHPENEYPVLWISIGDVRDQEILIKQHVDLSFEI